MKYLVFLWGLAFALASLAKEPCDSASIDLDESSSNIERHFYTGTCHYRNKEYELSVENWEKLAPLKPNSANDEELKIDVLNNLGYMRFFGYGTAKDQKLALSYWKEAILLGHEQSEYHLCHAYADREQPTYHLAKARKHCKKAKLIYKGKEEPDNDILSSIEFYLKKIGR